LKELNNALAELKKERRRVASLPPEAREELAKDQDKTADKTAKLAEEAGKQGSEGGQSPSGRPKPGQKQLQQAQQAMQQASGDLREDDPEGAERKQEEAIRQLEKALQEIEERLAQLREETQVERLARLEQRFREMLARQQEVNSKTIELDSKRSETLTRIERRAVSALAVEERELVEQAYQAYDILLEDGTSVVFPTIVDGLRSDLERVSELLEESRTGEFTQALQKEVETTLVEMIEALKKAKQQKKDGEGGGGGGQGGEPPLLPGSAELKLLRSSQMRVNRLTQSFEKERPEKAEDLDDTLKRQLDSITRRQSEITVLTERIMERLQRLQ